VIDPGAREATNQVFFGATITLADQDRRETCYSIVGIDEADATRGRISWVSPLARALLKRHEGERIVFQAPGGDQVLDIVAVEYKPLD
jgi:transcription elongation factor GreB